MLHSWERIGPLHLCSVRVDLTWILCKFDPVVTVNRKFHTGPRNHRGSRYRGNSTLPQAGYSNCSCSSTQILPLLIFFKDQAQRLSIAAHRMLTLIGE